MTDRLAKLSITRKCATIKTKVCPRCRARKFVRAFSKHRGNLDGRSSHCKTCCSAAQRARLRVQKPPTQNGLCTQLVRCKHMTEFRPCLNVQYHLGFHTPNLVGMRFGNLRVLNRGKDWIDGAGKREIRWNCVDTQGRQQLVFASSLFAGTSRGINAPKGSGHIRRDGYRVVCVGENRHVLEHRQVMEKKLGRPLRADETVHHKNGRRADNRDCNLELKAGAHGPHQRIPDLVREAIRILKLYAPKRLAKER